MPEHRIVVVRSSDDGDNSKAKRLSFSTDDGFLRWIRRQKHPVILFQPHSTRNFADAGDAWKAEIYDEFREIKGDIGTL